MHEIHTNSELETMAVLKTSTHPEVVWVSITSCTTQFSWFGIQPIVTMVVQLPAKIKEFPLTAYHIWSHVWTPPLNLARSAPVDIHCLQSDGKD